MKIKSAELGNQIMIAAIVVVSLTVLWQVVQPRIAPGMTYVFFGEHEFRATVAKTHQARTKGLSGTESLPKGEAMLFVFETDGSQPIWMKDMNYSIDIVWLDEHKIVVDFEKNATPESYPTKTFSSRQPARYVIELPEGTIKEKSIRIGQQAYFEV